MLRVIFLTNIKSRIILSYDTSTNLSCNIYDRNRICTCSGYNWSSHIAVVVSLTDNTTDKRRNLL